MKNEREAVLAAGVIIYRMQEKRPLFLLLENARHKTWGFPKGHLNGHESVEAAARRETAEETGLADLNLSPRFHKIIRYQYVPPGQNRAQEKHVHFFLASVDDEGLRISSEHSTMIWMERTQARSTLQFDSLREVLDCAFTHVAGLEGIEHKDSAVASALLAQLSQPDDMWRRHSEETARVAALLAEALIAADPTLPIDPTWVEAAGLLHDIGRTRSHGIEHPLEGFRLLTDKGLGHLAKPCISHWLKGRSRSRLEKDPHFTAELLAELYGNLDLDTFTMSEKTIALADSVVMHDRIVSIDERYRDADERYGNSNWMKENRTISLEICAEFDARLDRTVYELLEIAE